jgi:multidrug efflux pump subunit AcrA (membrane-fusion protein)
MNRQLDLQQLAIDREPPPASSSRHRRRWMARYVLPGTVMAGFLSILGWAARDTWLPSRPVTVVPVVVTRAELHTAGQPLFKAPGWVEPRPAPVIVSALAQGVVEELLVVEGQEVEARQPVARLIDADARLALQEAKADLELRDAERDKAEAQRTAAQLRLEQPVHLEAELAEADSRLAEAEGELAGLPLELRGAQARLRYAQQELDRKQAAGDAVAGRVVQQMESQLDGTEAEVERLQGHRPGLEQRIEALKRLRDALATQLELKIDESQQFSEAQALLKVAVAAQTRAQLAVDAAELQLERMVVRAPAAGRVLDVIAGPGTRTVGLAPNSMHDSGTIITLYDPKTLQVRADVRLEDVPLLAPGQAVRIETASAAGPIDGEVLLATSEANIQKNTLEVKVAIHLPPPAIRPEMLVEVTFLAPGDKVAGDALSASDDSAGTERLLIPRQLVETEGRKSFVWVASAEGTARRQEIRLGPAGTPQLVEALQGLNATDKLISGGRQGLLANQRIKITGQDLSMAMVDGDG